LLDKEKLTESSWQAKEYRGIRVAKERVAAENKSACSHKNITI
jgi:hypothetical protein